MQLPWRPIRQRDGTHTPSALSRRLPVPTTTDHRPRPWPAPADPDRHRGLVVCTEERTPCTANGRRLATGNHPVELLVPLMHLTDAGFGIDLATPTGAPTVIEHWAMPTDDAAVRAAYDRLETALAEPLDLCALAEGLDADGPLTGPLPAPLPRTVGLFLPGGHGALLGLPDDLHLARLLRWVHDTGGSTLSLCHGPAALLAAARDGGRFPWAACEAVAFPDRLDRLTPWIGDRPSPLTWFFGAALAAEGVLLRNTGTSGASWRDRDLVTGDSPEAADAFGVLAAETLLEEISAG